MLLGNRSRNAFMSEIKLSTVYNLYQLQANQLLPMTIFTTNFHHNFSKKHDLRR